MINGRKVGKFEGCKVGGLEGSKGVREEGT